MGITIVWDNNEHSVMRITFAKAWSWNEMDTIIAEAHAMMDAVYHQVDMIVDMKEGGSIPEGAFWRFHKLAQVKHRNRGRVIVVGGNSFIRTMSDTVRRLANDFFDTETFTLVSTVEEARATLFKMRFEMASGF
jgi:hypothetical protein